MAKIQRAQVLIRSIARIHVPVLRDNIRLNVTVDTMGQNRIKLIYVIVGDIAPVVTFALP